jgi:hypothetical protein
MEMDVIKWDMEMARRCMRRATQERENRTALGSMQRNAQAPEAAEADYWDEFRKEMDKLLKG